MWNEKYNSLCERTWECVSEGQRRVHKSKLPRHPKSTSLSSLDPNNGYDKETFLTWMHFSDQYQWPHIVLFNSLDELIGLLKTTDLKAVSANMAEFSR
jgi:hypothetical protein